MNPVILMQGLFGFIHVARDPNRLDKVFDISKKLSTEKAVDKLIEVVSIHDEGRNALSLQYRLGKVELDELKSLPKNTFGYSLFSYLETNSLSPDDIPTLKSSNAREYVLAHLYETHDIWHVVTGFDTSIAGELGLQAFYFAQLPTATAAILLAAGMINTGLYSLSEKDLRMDSIITGWKMGKRAKPLFGVAWKNQWNKPLIEIQNHYGIHNN